MPQISRSALVPFSAEQMYNIVNDVIAYPNFLTGCVASEIISYSHNQMTASLKVSIAGMSQTFITKNMLETNQSIHIQLVEGFFRKFTGRWDFIPFSSYTSKINFYLEFEFTNTLLKLAFNTILKTIANNILQIFMLRAKDVYSV